MGYLKIRNFRINRKSLSVTFTAASSNVRSWDDKLIYEQDTMKFSTKEELENYLVTWANDVLGGMIKMPRAHAFVKRVQYLKDNGFLSDKQGWFSLENPTDEAKKILSGEKQVYVPMYIVVGPNYGLKVNKATYGLRDKSNATKFLSKESAESFLEKIPQWKKSYQLEIVSI